MIDLASQRQRSGPLHIIDATTAVDCTKDVGVRRSFRTLVERVVPFCCGFHHSPGSSDTEVDSVHATFSTVTGTFFGHRRGRVSFCLQDHSRSPPLLLLELAIPTSRLAKEMHHGLLRIALECDRSSARSPSCSLFSVPVWSTYCNGRKVGFTVRKKMSENDAAVLKLMQKVSVGAGVLPVKSSDAGDCDLMYLRASFERVIGSPNSQSFHMINPVGSTGQELSIFFLRS